MNALLITGTDTETGKTVLTTALAAYWQRFVSPSLGIMKPIQAGIGDRELYSQLFTLNQSIDEINPLYFDAPLAPPIAAAKEGRTIDLAKSSRRIALISSWSTTLSISSGRRQDIPSARVDDRGTVWLPSALSVPKASTI